METFLSADNDDDLAVVASKIEIILINSWLGFYDLSAFPTILVANCKAQTLLAISKFYKNLKISSVSRYQKEELIYEKVIIILLELFKIHCNFYISKDLAKKRKLTGVNDDNGHKFLKHS